jgi:hypothetical protein
MNSRLIKNTKGHNKGKDINNDLRDVPCQRKRHLCNHRNSNMFITHRGIAFRNCIAS